jgi:predicted phosphohydrolase
MYNVGSMPRILLTSDLHYRPVARGAYLAFAEQVRAGRPDCFIIAGDIGHPLRLFRRALQLFANLDCPRYLLTGNHDVYRGEYDSRSLWQEWLPRVATEEGFGWLEGQTPILGKLGICGSMAWYDYSSHAAHLSYQRRHYSRFKHLVSNDADYIDWPWSDIAMARYLQRGLARRLAQLDADPHVEHTLVVTHMPIFEQAVPQRPEREFWSLLQAYLANYSIGDLVRRHPKVSHVVSGHLHRRLQWIEQGYHGPITCHLLGGGAGNPEALILDFP